MKSAIYATVSLAIFVFPGIVAADAVAEIEATGQEFESALNAGDAEALAGLFTDDAVVLPPDMPRLEGRDAIRDLWQGFIDVGVQGELTVDEVEVLGDTAIKVGSYTVTIPGEDGAETTETGKFLEVLKQEEGAWRIHRDIWNADAAE